MSIINKKQFKKELQLLKQRGTAMDFFTQNVYQELVKVCSKYGLEDCEFFDDIMDSEYLKYKITDLLHDKCCLEMIKNLICDIDPRDDYFIDDGYGWARQLEKDDIFGIIDNIIQYELN